MCVVMTKREASLFRVHRIPFHFKKAITIENQTTGDRSQARYANASIAAPKLSAHIELVSANE